ncbi:uncharacterized protein [Anoplolepis gracilipes]|uniref:uncharacterized protein isoform X2 n=1 Tax=Anoplolepis gracilipes TaxID=354296 RepID=UPI003BA3B7BD
MENNKPRGSRRGNNRRKNGGGNKENKREIERMKKSRSEESVLWSHHLVPDDNESKIDITEQQTSLDLENFEEDENNPKTSFMCPTLRRQLQTHRNVLRLLHEHKLVSTQINGQRILSIQPVRWTGPTPGIDCEIFVGRIPKTIYEDTLYPLFKTIGEIFQIRLMVDMAELTRGYCFIMYTNPDYAARAIVQLDQYEILPGKKIRVLASVNKCKLYIGPLPWYIASEEVVRVIYASAWDIEYVSIYRFTNNEAAYAIVSFKSHRNAALARRKLRPEKLFKCNEVHVEWARVDWNPSNVYEDRGTVDDKGDVHIIRKYLQPKKTATSNLMQNELNHCQKKLPPISPPSSLGTSDNNRDNPVKSVYNSYSTYVSMLNMSLDALSPCDKKTETLTDINDNVQLLDVVKEQQTRNQKSDNDAADSFRNFDMWNSNLVSQLPGSPANSGSSKESQNMMICESADDYPSSKAIPSLGRSTTDKRQLGNVSNYHYSPCTSSRSFGKTIDQNQLIVTDPAVRYQVVHNPYPQNGASCYVLLQPQSYMCPKDAIVTSPQASVVNSTSDEQARLSLFAGCDRRAFWLNGNQIAMDKDFIVGDGGEFRRERAPAKLEVDTASGNYVQNYSPNMLNFTPIYMSSTNGGMTPCFVSLNAVNNKDEKQRPRAILKQTMTSQAPWL